MPLRGYAHILMWILYFSSGLFQIYQVLPGLMNTVALGLNLSLFMTTIFRGRPKLPHLTIIIALGVVTIISGQIVNIGIPLKYSLVFYRQIILLPYLYFIVILNERDEKILRAIFKTLIILYSIQLIAAIIKYLTVGQMELYIGTISYSEGSLGALIPLMSISYLYSKYLYTKKNYLLLLIVFFILFGIVGGKRALLFFVPLLLVCITIFYSIKSRMSIAIIFRRLFATFLLAVVLIVLSAKMIPTLNPEGKIFGSFDINYVINFSQDYAFGAKSTRMTRAEGLIYFSDYLFKKDITTIEFGEGAGKLVASSYSSYTAVDAIDYHYNLKYGGRLGVIYIFLQIGIFGLTIYGMFWISMFNSISHSNFTYHTSAIFGMLLSVVLDILAYSTASIMYFPVIGVLFSYYGLLRRNILVSKLRKHE